MKLLDLNNYPLKDMEELMEALDIKYDQSITTETTKLHLDDCQMGELKYINPRRVKVRVFDDKYTLQFTNLRLFVVPEDSENLFGVRQIPNFSVMHCGQFESQAIINVHRRKCIDFEGNDSQAFFSNLRLAKILHNL